MDLYGSRIGVVSGDRQFTFTEFGQRAERLATGLEKLGIAAGDRVAYLSYNNHQLLEGYFGVIQARAILMPLNVRLSEPELAAILRHSGAKMVIFEDDFADTVRTRSVAARSRRCPDEIRQWIAHEEILDQGCPDRADVFSYDEMAIAELFYTSGSTGAPKGVTLSHRTLYLHALSVAPGIPGPGNHSGPVHHSAVSRQWMGASAGLHHDGDQTGDGAAIRTSGGVPADPRAKGDQSVRGPDHGQRARPCV